MLNDTNSSNLTLNFNVTLVIVILATKPFILYVPETLTKITSGIKLCLNMT